MLTGSCNMLTGSCDTLTGSCDMLTGSGDTLTEGSCPMEMKEKSIYSTLCILNHAIHAPSL